MINSIQAEKQHKKLKSRWSEESQLTQRVIIGILKELESLNGNKLKEEKEEPEQEAGMQRFRCETCKTSGTVEEWDEKEGETTKKIIRDCPECKGEGFRKVMVVDKRKNTKNRKLRYDDEY